MLNVKDLHDEVYWYFALSSGQFKSICYGETDAHIKGV